MKVPKTTLLNRIKKNLENNLIVVIVWMVIVFLSSLITLSQGFAMIYNYYNETIAYKDNLREIVENLDPNQQLHTITDVLGNADLIKEASENDQGATRAYIFIKEYFYLQALTDRANNILAITVTSRDRDFNPEFEIPALSSSVVLGRSTFSSVLGDIEGGCFIRIGAHNFSYFEGSYMANPGNYQSFYIGINDAGYPESWWKTKGFDGLYDVGMSPDWKEADGDCSSIPDLYRKNAVVNTFTITAPFVFFSPKEPYTPDILFGVNINDVRVIGK